MLTSELPKGNRRRGLSGVSGRAGAGPGDEHHLRGDEERRAGGG